MTPYIISVITFMVGFFCGLYRSPYRDDAMLQEAQRLRKELKQKEKLYDDLVLDYTDALHEISKFSQKLARSL